MATYEGDRKLFQVRFVYALLCGDGQMSEQDAVGRMKTLQIDSIQLPCVVVCIAPRYNGCDYHERDRMILNYEQYVNRAFTKAGYTFQTCVNANEQMQIIVKVKENDDLEEWLIALRKKLQLRFDDEVFIGMGSCVDRFSRISVSANEAMQMLAYKYQYSDRGVINITNIVRFRHNISYGSEEMLDRVIGCFQDGDLGKMAVRLDELIAEIRYRPNVSGSSIKRTIIELTVHMLHIASNARVDVDELLMGEDPYRWIIQQEETPVITEWFMNLASRLMSGIREQQDSGRKRIIELSCEYIEANLNDNTLGLQHVCERNGLSASYFSQLFKKEMNIGLSNYIMQRRVERAKELLLTTDLKNEEIAMQLGFTRQNYFGLVFKRITGMSPSAFRQQKMSMPKGK